MTLIHALNKAKLDFYFKIDLDLATLGVNKDNYKLFALGRGTPNNEIKSKAIKHWACTYEDKIVEEIWLFYAEDLEGLPVMPDFDD